MPVLLSHGIIGSRSSAGPALVSLGALVLTGSPAFGQPTTAGDFLVAWTAVNYTYATTCSDPTWSRITYADPTGFGADMWYKANCGGSETAPTFNSTNASMLAEFSGVAALVASGTTGTSNPNSASISLSNASTDPAAPALVVAGAMGVGGITLPVTVSMTDGSGGVITSHPTYGNPAPVFAWAITGAAGAAADAVTFTWSTAGFPCAVIASAR